MKAQNRIARSFIGEYNFKEITLRNGEYYILKTRNEKL